MEGLFQPLHLLLIFGIALLIFGPSKLAGLGKGLGEGIRNFKSSMKEGTTAPPAATAAGEVKDEQRKA
ncbi:MAG TPA: twin-arginine translocase TatA/TatE family subunit [Terriglobales bacterium]|jgi:sec-independent protein translocase protein TatA|nr:twin-arginine translocase TatA/TatE family subunit [Terriglobales bacterium]